MPGRRRESCPRLLVLFSSQLRGGCEGYALTVARAAVGRCWDVHAAFPSGEGTLSLIHDFGASGVAYHQLRIEERPGGQEPKANHLGRLFRTLRLLLRIRPNAVLFALADPTHGTGSLVACALLRMPTTVVFQLAWAPFSVGPRRIRLMRWVRRTAQRWVAVSEDNRRMVARSFDARDDEITVIHNGVRLPESGIERTSGIRTSALRQAVREELGLAGGARLVVAVGRLDRQKGLDLLVAAMPELIQDFPDVRFVHLGEGPEDAALREEVRELGVGDRVHFLGYRSDVSRFLEAGDLFAFPSRFEGFPFALLEAMAHGLPAVSSNASSMPEIVSDRVHGLLFPSEDRERLRDALAWALRHPKDMSHMAARAVQRARDFTEEKMLRKTLDWFEETTIGTGARPTRLRPSCRSTPGEDSPPLA